MSVPPGADVQGIERDVYKRQAQAEDGWRCACGAFNYNAGLGKRMCTECGADKAMLAAAVHEAQRRSVPQRHMYDASMQVLPTQEASCLLYTPRCV